MPKAETPLTAKKTRKKRGRNAKFKYNFRFNHDTSKQDLWISLPFSAHKEGYYNSKFNAPTIKRSEQSEIIKKIFEVSEIESMRLKFGGSLVILAKKKDSPWQPVLKEIEKAVQPFIDDYNAYRI